MSTRHLAAADSLSEQNNLADALHEYNLAIRLNPQGSDAYYRRGRAHQLLGERQQAIEDFTQSIRLNPQLAEPTSTEVTRSGTWVNRSRLLTTTARRYESTRRMPQPTTTEA